MYSYPHPPILEWGSLSNLVLYQMYNAGDGKRVPTEPEVGLRCPADQLQLKLVSQGFLSCPAHSYLCVLLKRVLPKFGVEKHQSTF